MKHFKNQFFILIIIGIFISLFTKAQSKIEHLEPPFWWAGMKNQELQLLVHGKNIAELDPQLEYAGVSLKQTIKVKNPNYLFLNLEIGENASPGTFSINFKKDNKTVDTYNYRLLSREQGSATRQGFESSDVMYLITPDRFVNGNPDNDNIAGMGDKANRQDPLGRHGGDIQGIADHLDYIDEMGFTAIWVNPVLENDQPVASYHGYATTDFYKVDSRFGSNEEYKKLAELAKSKGIKLIMDMILNHCGSGHWWMRDPPTDDWINFQDIYTQTNHRRTTVQDPHASAIDFKIFQHGWFVETMPDLNQQNPLMATYLIQNTIWWIEYAGLAGIRMDTYPYPDIYFMAAWTCRVQEEYPNFNVVGEEWSLNPAIVSFWQKGKVNANGYVSCLPSLMDFPIQHAIVRGLTEEESWNKGLIKPYEMLANDFLYADPYNLVIFPDNHDMDRFYAQVGNDYDLYKLGLAYFLTMRGIPQIYYGTEILMANPGQGDHGLIRSDFPGGWKGDKVNAFTGKGLSAQQKEAKDYMKKLLQYRKSSSVIHSGKLTHFAPQDGMYVYFRHNDQGKVMVVLNKSENEQDLELDRFQEMLKGVGSGKDVLGNKTINLRDKLKVPARSPLILELKNGEV